MREDLVLSKKTDRISIHRNEPIPLSYRDAGPRQSDFTSKRTTCNAISAISAISATSTSHTTSSNGSFPGCTNTITITSIFGILIFGILIFGIIFDTTTAVVILWSNTQTTPIHKRRSIGHSIPDGNTATTTRHHTRGF